MRKPTALVTLTNGGYGIGECGVVTPQIKNAIVLTYIQKVPWAPICRVVKARYGEQKIRLSSSAGLINWMI